MRVWVRVVLEQGSKSLITRVAERERDADREGEKGWRGRREAGEIAKGEAREDARDERSRRREQSESVGLNRTSERWHNR